VPAPYDTIDSQEVAAVRNTLLSLAFTAALGLPAAITAQEKPTLETKAVAWMELMRTEKFDSAAAALSPLAREQGLGTEQLKSFWPQIVERYGALKKVTPSNRLQQNGLEVVQLLGFFEKGTQNVRVSFDGEGRVAGFFIVGAGGGPPGA
jgi:Protein of unknown function (DUF3887)